MIIQIDPHTLERAEARGANEEDILDFLLTGFSIPAKHNRLGKAKVYNFQQPRQGRYYEQKRVEVIYFVDNDVVITVTVYLFYGKWENTDADLL
jgi:hypothetical protein